MVNKNTVPPITVIFWKVEKKCRIESRAVTRTFRSSARHARMPIYWFTDDGTKVGYLSSYTGEMGDVALGEEFVLGAEHVALLEGFGAHENASRAKGWLGFHRDLRGTLASMSAVL